MSMIVVAVIAYLMMGLILHASERDNTDSRDEAVVAAIVVLLWPYLIPVRLHNKKRRAGRDRLAVELRIQQLIDKNKDLRKRIAYETSRDVDSVELLQDVLAAIEPYVNWREITDDLDGKTAEAWADAIDAAHYRADKRDGLLNTDKAYSPTDRWWRNGLEV